jgi:trehalose utilization protein
MRRPWPSRSCCTLQNKTERERLWLKEFVNRMLRGLFGPIRKKLTIDSRKLYNEEFMIDTPCQIFLG